VHGEGDATLLILAAANNQADIVDYLISQKVDVNKQNADGKIVE
jgi:ankyrin repeat protein